MPLPLLIVVTGLPASGKTTLSRRIANDLHLPLISRDGIKEILFDGLGWSDREWSKRLGKVSYELTYYFVQLHIASGQPVIVESNFTEQAVTAFSAIRRQRDFAAFQIICDAPPEILLARYIARVESGERHPGHADHLNYDEMRKLLVNPPVILDLAGDTVRVDTSDMQSVNYDRILDSLRVRLGRD